MVAGRWSLVAGRKSTMGEINMSKAKSSLLLGLVAGLSMAVSARAAQLRLEQQRAGSKE
jgi:hypothetical protein